jgi:hypothetical protein
MLDYVEHMIANLEGKLETRTELLTLIEQLTILHYLLFATERTAPQFDCD